MLDRGTAAFTLATVAVAWMALAVLLSLAFYGGQYWALLIGPAAGLVLAAGVWLALRRVCRTGSRAASLASFAGIVLLCAWSFVGVSFGGLAAIPAALTLMVAHAVVPSPR